MNDEINLFHGNMRLLTDEGYKSLSDLYFYKNVNIIVPGGIQKCGIEKYGKCNVIELGMMWSKNKIVSTKEVKIITIRNERYKVEESLYKIIKSHTHAYGYEVLSINRKEIEESYRIVYKGEVIIDDKRVHT